MTIRFAPARNRPNCISAIIGGCENSYGIGANDNGAPAANDDDLLANALRHFAIHGMGAAEQAQELAVEARESGDEAEFALWLAICKMFDTRRARWLNGK